MSTETRINGAVNSTVINSQITGSSTVTNIQISESSSIAVGTILDDIYTVKEKLNVPSGEADLYLCTDGNKDYVAKIYRRRVAVKEEVTEKLKSVDSPYVAKVYHAGEFNGFPYEILPYYKNGSLKGKTFTYEQLRMSVIPSINEGLHVLHEAGILHKDLKPSNIMLADNGSDIAIIDFGISSIKEDESTVIVTRTGMTPEYSAPETFKNLFLNESDYYSMGVTLYELFCGHTPYEQMSQDEIEKFVSVQKLPLPDNMNENLKILILALTYSDITNRKNKSNPNRRWGYEEVMKWIIGIKQPIPGEITGTSSLSGDMKPYKFLGETYTDKIKLLEALNANWEDGKKQLYRGLLSAHFKTFDAEVAGFCMDAEEEVSKGDEDIIFFKTFYKIEPTLRTFMWKGRKYDDISAFGNELQNVLWNNTSDSGFFSFVDEILDKGVLSAYISSIDSNSEEHIKSIMAYESSNRTYRTDARQKLINYYMLAYMLSGNKVLHMNGMKFKTVDNLALYLKEKLDVSFEEFEKVCNMLIDYNDILEPQFESWLLSLGKKAELEQWRKSLNF